MTSRTLPAPARLRSRMNRAEKGWTSCFNCLGRNEVAHFLTSYPPPNSLVFLSEFNLHSTAGTSCLDEIDIHHDWLETHPDKITVQVAPKFADTKVVNWTLTEYIDNVFTTSVRLVNGRSSSGHGGAGQLSEAKFGAIKSEVERSLSTMYPQNNMLKMLASSGYCDFVAYVDGLPVFIIWGTHIYALFNHEALGHLSPCVTFDFCFQKMLDYFLVPKRQEKRPTFGCDDLTVGMDPELEGYFIREDGPDFDAQCFAHKLIERQNGRVGCDGHSDIFELRPKFSTNPKVVVENTRKCFETLGFVIASAGKPVYLLAGGGILDSIGGHIHMGGSFFQNIATDEIGAFFGPIMDDFVYWPIRDRMPGAIRAWGNHPVLARKKNVPPTHCGFPDKKPVVIFDKITQAEKRRDHNFAGYDGPGAFRWTNYGFEYRSLPSFIVGPDLTELILTMALCSARKMISCYNTGQGLTYNLPPKKSDYLAIFPEDIYHRFGRYINGDKNKIFLTNALDNWGVGTGTFKPVVKISSDCSGDSLYRGIEISRKLNKFLSKVYSENKELASVNVIDIFVSLNENIDSPYVCKCGKLYVVSEGCMKDAFNFGAQRQQEDSTIRVNVLLCPEDSPNDIFAIVDSIALALCSKIGTKDFSKFRKIMLSILKTYSDPPSGNFVIVESGKDTTTIDSHQKIIWTDDEITNYYELIGEEESLCEEYVIRQSCRCMHCTAMRDFRDENCGPCGSTLCRYYPDEEDNSEDSEEEEF